MWTVLEHRTKATRVIDSAPLQVQRKYTVWKQIVQRDGPFELRKLPGFKDHALKGRWEGYRSSYLNDQYRVIYNIEKETVTVFVEQVGPHDY
ncbi:MAG: type II toxin-antitoxin system mRNA interferase toxin, RelE/StbE family [bacterium]